MKTSPRTDYTIEQELRGRAEKIPEKRGKGRCPTCGHSDKADRSLRDDLIRGANRIEFLERALGEACVQIQDADRERKRVDDLLFPNSMPTGDLTYLTIKDMVNTLHPPPDWQEEPECGEDCPMCTGSICQKCGAGSWRRPDLDGVLCDHDVCERHEEPDA